MEAAIVGAIVGALVTVLVTRLLTPDHSKRLYELQEQIAESQRRIAELEQEKRDWETLERFSPHHSIIRTGPLPQRQFIHLEADREFRVTQMEYLTGDGTCAARQPTALSGKSVDVPIEDAKVLGVQKLGHDPYDGSAAIQFRLRLKVGEQEKPLTILARIKPETILIPGDGRMEYRGVIG